MEASSSNQPEEQSPLTALEQTNLYLRRLLKRMEEAEGGTLDEAALELDMRRARRQLRLNRELFARKGDGDRVVH